MVKIRDPQTFAGAVRTAIEAIGVGRIAAAVERGERSVHGWSDPDADTLPSIRQAYQIDAALIAAGHPPLLHRAYAERLEALAHVHVRENPVSDVLRVGADFGRIADSVRRAMDPSGPGGRAITRNERLALAQQISEAITDLRQLSLDLDSPSE